MANKPWDAASINDLQDIMDNVSNIQVKFDALLPICTDRNFNEYENPNKSTLIFPERRKLQHLFLDLWEFIIKNIDKVNEIIIVDGKWKC